MKFKMYLVLFDIKINFLHLSSYASSNANHMLYVDSILIEFRRKPIQSLINVSPQ